MEKTVEKLVKTYKGYFNYYLLSDMKSGVKTYHFNRLKKSQVDKLRVQFSNPDKYKFIGEQLVRDKDKLMEVKVPA
jgi:hypothetical protein